MGADQSFALPFYEKLASHYGQSRQPGPFRIGAADVGRVRGWWGGE